MNNSLWKAFCTIHWFITGEYEVCKSTSCYTHELFNWYIVLESNAEEDFL